MLITLLIAILHTKTNFHFLLFPPPELVIFKTFTCTYIMHIINSALTFSAYLGFFLSIHSVCWSCFSNSVLSPRQCWPGLMDCSFPVMRFTFGFLCRHHRRCFWFALSLGLCLLDPVAFPWLLYDFGGIFVPELHDNRLLEVKFWSHSYLFSIYIQLII